MRISIRMGGRLIRDGLITSAAVWLGLMGYWALTEVLIGRYPPGRRQISPEGLTSLVIYATLGLAASGQHSAAGSRPLGTRASPPGGASECRSRWEPLMHGVPLFIVSNGRVRCIRGHSYAFNFAAAVSFRRFGLLAAVLVRLGNYLVWHVAYGNFLF